jgi:hypothetical protein
VSPAPAPPSDWHDPPAPSSRSGGCRSPDVRRSRSHPHHEAGSSLTAAHHYQQLAGGKGYRCDSPSNNAGQAFLDTRVFTIFDGTNDLLSQQPAECCLTRRAGQPLNGFLASWAATAPAVTAHRLDLRFLDRDLGQEHLVLAGRAIAYALATT